MVDLVVFPSGFYKLQEVDADLKEEYEAALSTGLFDTVFFGYDQWIGEGKLQLSSKQYKKRKAVYRGWMMKPEQYEAFYREMFDNNVELVTTPEEYALMHIFPNIYEAFGTDTAQMELFPLHERIDIEDVKKRFDRFMVKDYVKSVKGTEFPRYFTSEVTQDEFDKWMEVFCQYRGNLLTGGICIKQFLDLKQYGDKTNEYRVFYVNHLAATVSKNSAQPNYASTVPKELVEKYKNLDSIYYTVDFAELEDGTWKVIEAGDGSVSGLSEFQNAEAYYRALYHALNNVL